MTAVRLALMTCLTGIISLSPPARAQEMVMPVDQAVGSIEQVMAFTGAMPTGVTVSRDSRIFVNFPRWGDDVPFTVAELKGGRPVAYPSIGINTADPARAATTFVSVQSVVVDAKNRLWVLDTGSPRFEPVIANGAKLVGIDLSTNRVVKTIVFPPDIALTTSYLNDVRFDLSRGPEGVAYITDSSLEGTNGLIVVDLATGRSRRRLHNHPSTMPQKDFLPIIEGQPVMNRPPDGKATHLTAGSDGIALSHDGMHLYYSPLSSHRLYRVRTDVLVDEKAGDEAVANAVEDLGDRGFASDGLEFDEQGRLYLTDYENNAIVRRDAKGSYETLVRDPRMLWPDTLSVANDGYLYFIANQLHRQPGFHEGRDLRVKPYSLFRAKIDGTPITRR